MGVFFNTIPPYFIFITILGIFLYQGVGNIIYMVRGLLFYHRHGVYFYIKVWVILFTWYRGYYFIQIRWVYFITIIGVCIYHNIRGIFIYVYRDTRGLLFYWGNGVCFLYQMVGYFLQQIVRYLFPHKYRSHFSYQRVGIIYL